jgi:hypothetical protein
MGLTAIGCSLRISSPIEGIAAVMCAVRAFRKLTLICHWDACDGPGSFATNSGLKIAEMRSTYAGGILA